MRGCVAGPWRGRLPARRPGHDPGPYGRQRTFDDAIGEFAVDYADQNERDYRGFVRAVKEGRIQATADIQTNLLSREPLHDLDQFLVCVAGRIAEFAGRV